MLLLYDHRDRGSNFSDFRSSPNLEPTLRSQANAFGSVLFIYKFLSYIMKEMYFKY